MSDNQQQEGAGIAEGEVIFNANILPKTLEFGDGGGGVSSASSLHENLMIKTEMEGDISVKAVNSRTKSISPSSKRSSKRKRKNRRRREKKAAAASTDGDASGGTLIDDGTGTETEFSQNSEDTRKDEDTGTESETTCHDEKDFDLEDSSICIQPSVTSIPEEDLSGPMLQDEHVAPVDSAAGCRKVEEMESKEKTFAGNTKRGPTHSVDTLLQIAKCKILSQILEPVHENNDTASITRQSDSQDDGSSKLVVPPCSPSSLHSINTTGNSRETSVSSSEETQKPVTKNVHFDQRPPEIVTVTCTSTTTTEEPVFKLKSNNESGVGPDGENASKVKETIVLTGSVGNTESATSSIASETSAASLLKGSGSSNEDFVESSHHYPSRESVGDSVEQQQSNNNHSEIDVDTFRETIQIFKIQNPVEAQHIGNEVDSILTKSLDRFTTLMESSAAAGVHDTNSSMICVSGANVETYKIQEHEQELTDSQNIQIQLDDDANNTFVVNSGSENESAEPINTESDMEVDDSRLSMNTTFIVEKVAEEHEKSSPRPLSPGEVMPQAIPDTVSDTDSVTTTGHLSIVPEEDEDDGWIPLANISKNNIVSNFPNEQVEVEAQLSTLSQTFSAASCCTVIETDASVHQKPADTSEGFVSMQSNEAATSISSTVGAADNLQEQENDSTSKALSSASSTKSSVSSPRCEDLNENVVDTVIPVVVASSRPSTGETFECGQTESEFEMGNEEGTESVEVFTLHFPSVPVAPPSENNLDSGNGDQPYFVKGNIAELAVPGTRDNATPTIITSPHQRKDWNLTGRETETDSDWLPERRNSLQQVINEREISGVAAIVEAQVEELGVGSSRNGSIKAAEQPPDGKAEDAEDDQSNDQGCNCAKMCVIT